MKHSGLIGIFLIFAGCGGSDSSAPGDAGTTLTGDIKKVTVSIKVEDTHCNPTSLNGVELIFSDQAGGAQDEAIASGERQLKIKITDLSKITLGTDYIVNSDNTSITFYDGESRYIGTSGSLNFTALSRNSGSAVTGSFSLGFVDTDVDLTATANLAGSVDTLVE